jgi:GTP-binding protein
MNNSVTKPTDKLRNIAIIAHVDHGKTTLVDKLLRQSGTLDARFQLPERAMDSNDLEKERGITILAKNTAITWGDYFINIIDTPGHADFGGEVERVLSMADCVLLLVDAVDGPMPQTRFVTQKAFAFGFTPIVVINKIDRDGARPGWALDATFELFDRLGATNAQLDFPVIYASALNGYAGLESSVRSGDMTPLFEAIVKHVAPPKVDPNGPLQLQVSSLDYDSYVGMLGIGRITRGKAVAGSTVSIVGANGKVRSGRLGELYGFLGLNRYKVESASAGDIVVFSGIEELFISDTVCDREVPEGLPPLKVDEPTISMTFCVNKSPFAGKEGKFLTSRHIKERLERELKHNVALRVEPTEDPDKFKVSGRGELHLSILIENMRREGYELAVSRPEVIEQEIDGVRLRTVGTAHGRFRRAVPGCGDESPRRAQGRAADHDAGWHGPSASGIPHAGAWPDRLPYRISDLHLGHRADLSRLRKIRSPHSGLDRPAQQWRADFHGGRQGAGLCAVQPAGARSFVHRPWRAGVRRHDLRHTQPGQRPGHQSDQGQAADQYPRRRHG